MTDAATYQVLARKYRPQVFADLVGQEAMVRTLTNAFAADRIAHAFVLTGVRGVGKTTTARIIAKGLNCEGPDGKGGITVSPCGVCGPCRAIAEGRHVDVLEMDAATHTQVDRMRELLASVPYRPAESRMKIYIIDEVHMLSTASFNALLKTLEEPPAHVKFIFATTEIRKVPVTVLSRCQRFDLRRIEPEVMTEFLTGIAQKEGAQIDPDALALIVRAAEGSARDALSLLDQAIAHGAGATDREAVRQMLGLADRGRVLDLFELIMRGEVAGALAELSAQYAAGADPLAVLRDLAEVTHWISVLNVAPDAAEDPTIAPDERRRGRELAERLAIPALARSWQMLLKALDEVATAPNAMMAAEMAIIRLTHVADLPAPADLVRRLSQAGTGASAPHGPAGTTPSPPARPAPAQSAQNVPQLSGNLSAQQSTQPNPQPNLQSTLQTGAQPNPPLQPGLDPPMQASATDPLGPGAQPVSAPAYPPVSQPISQLGAQPIPQTITQPAGAPALQPELRQDPGSELGPAPGPTPAPTPGPELGPAMGPQPSAQALPQRFEDAVDMIRTARDMRLLLDLERHLRLVAYSPGRIEFQPTPDAPPRLASDLAHRLGALTGTRWAVSIAATGGGATLAEARDAAARDLRSRMAEHPLVAAALATFPGAEIREIRPGPGTGAAAAPDPAANAADAPIYIDPEDAPDDWDPFDMMPGEEE
ncbi:MAG: DNA polymerase III subunit gamma/tau [Pseudomonadota bacterium]